MPNKAVTKRNKQAPTILAQASITQHEGPLPLPETLADYEQVLTGLAERIVVMAENEAAQRHGVENKIVKANLRDGLLGIIFAFILCLSTIIGGVLVAIFYQTGAWDVFERIWIGDISRCFYLWYSI
ncbi:MAG: DUF2335 domain-containing protein [Firmicutes bacterium]|nr:DUF2335 domain-containing protein [Bacillota bacterium]